MQRRQFNHDKVWNLVMVTSISLVAVIKKIFKSKAVLIDR